MASALRDADPLLLTAAQLVRIAAKVDGREAYGVEKIPDSRTPLLGGQAGEQPKRLLDDRFDGLPRIERAERILENHLHAAAKAAQGRIWKSRDILAFEANLARCRLGDAQEAARQCGLAAAALTDQPDRFARADGEVDAVDSADDGPTTDREVLDQSTDLDQGFRRDVDAVGARRDHGRLNRSAPGPSLRLPSCATQQRTSWPSSRRRSDGSSRRHRSSTQGQR